jgi:hypothetical protein
MLAAYNAFCEFFAWYIFLPLLCVWVVYITATAILYRNGE